MTDENSEQNDSVQPDEEPTGAAPETPTPDEDHRTKHTFREGVARAVGYTVEVASILGQQGGDAVKAERDVAEADTEGFIDRIDGEG